MLDPRRHVSIFDPDAFGNRRVDVIGCGAVGSYIALSLAKLGVVNIRLHDFDKVESHNIANQAFDLEHIGRLKVDALSEVMKRATGVSPTTSYERVTGDTRLGPVVFLAVDSMAARKEIWEGCIKYSPGAQLMVETRMGEHEAMVYTIEPLNPEQVEFWSTKWYPDSAAVESVCSTPITVGATAQLTASTAVWQFIRWFSMVQTGTSAPPPTELILNIFGSIITKTVGDMSPTANSN